MSWWWLSATVLPHQHLVLYTTESQQGFCLLIYPHTHAIIIFLIFHLFLELFTPNYVWKSLIMWVYWPFSVHGVSKTQQTVHHLTAVCARKCVVRTLTHTDATVINIWMCFSLEKSLLSMCVWHFMTAAKTKQKNKYKVTVRTLPSVCGVLLSVSGEN